MLRIAITPPEILTDEAAQIMGLLSSGWDYVHLRHPQASLCDIRHIIEAIPQQFHSKLKLHGHFEIVNHFNIGGLHLNNRCPTPPRGFSGKLSRSCHTPLELSNAIELEYVTFSPVFPSISKPDYNPRYKLQEIAEAVEKATVPVVALGGVRAEYEPQIAEMGFAGYACLGYIWQQQQKQ